MEKYGLTATKPIVFLDTETTGTNPETDKIVELALIKLYPSGKTIETSILINPEIPIPKGASDIHGITDEKVKDALTFREIAPKTKAFLDGCDLAGYNSNAFDIPLLSNEFSRCGIVFPNPDQKLIDGYLNECRLTSRKLSDVYTKYTSEILEGAHGALADTRATLAVIVEQCAREQRLITVEELCELTAGSNVDWAGKMKYDDQNRPCWTFGKNFGKPIFEDANYLNWFINNADTPRQTKIKIAEEMEVYEAMLRDHNNS